MNKLSISKAKYIKSLQLKKNRLQERSFLVEGEKSVLEFLKSEYTVRSISGTEEFYLSNNFPFENIDLSLASSKELASLGIFKSNNSAIAIVAMPEEKSLEIHQDEVIIALDEVNDPGNMGTIIRIADWFGIKQVLVSAGSVDIYNPKVVSATKGSLCHIGVNEVNLSNILANYDGPVLAADMHGESLAKLNPISRGIILMGSESHGISPELENYISKRITIDKVGNAESLNVAVATGIICHHLVQPS